MNSGFEPYNSSGDSIDEEIENDNSSVSSDSSN